MADLLGQAEQPKIEATPPEDAYVEAERKALEDEQKLEQQKDFLEQPDVDAPTTKIVEGQPVQTAPAPPQAPRDEVLVEVEKIMEKGLADVYKSLPDSAKPIFKKKGEETAAALAQMVRSLNIQFKRALQMVRDWLLTIPKVNKFFLEQEAKIKVDELQALVEERKNDTTTLA